MLENWGWSSGVVLSWLLKTGRGACQLFLIQRRRRRRRWEVKRRRNACLQASCDSIYVGFQKKGKRSISFAKFSVHFVTGIGYIGSHKPPECLSLSLPTVTSPKLQKTKQTLEPCSWGRKKNVRILLWSTVAPSFLSEFMRFDRQYPIYRRRTDASWRITAKC